MSNDTITSTYRDLNDNYGWAGTHPDRTVFDRVSGSSFAIGSAFIEFFLITGLSLGMLGYFVGFDIDQISGYVLISLAVGAVILLLFKNANLYKVEMIAEYRSAIGQAIKIWTLSFLCLASTGVLTKMSDEYSRLWFVSWFFVGLVGLVGERLITGRLFRLCVDRGYLQHSVVIVGASTLTAAFLTRIKSNKYGIKVDAIFDEIPNGKMLSDPPVQIDGNLDDLLMYQKTHRIDTLVIALPMADTVRLRKIVRHLSIQALRIRILPGELALESPRKWFSPLGEIPGVQLMAISDRPIALWGHLIKNVLDKVFALFALCLAAPIMIACVIGIKLNSPGPVFFRQKRIGYRNRMFEVYKFRSMHAVNSNTGMLTQRNDPRVFAFGQIMRKLSFDELPQLFNVLKGEMSLVGPRPHMPEARAAGRFYFDVVNEYAYRHRVKPGITGWAQVNGWRGPTETVEQIENRVIHDLYYIDNWSLGMDIAIIAKTVLVGFFGKNAF